MSFAQLLTRSNAVSKTGKNLMALWIMGINYYDLALKSTPIILCTTKYLDCGKTIRMMLCVCVVARPTVKIRIIAAVVNIKAHQGALYEWI